MILDSNIMRDSSFKKDHEAKKQLIEEIKNKFPDTIVAYEADKGDYYNFYIRLKKGLDIKEFSKKVIDEFKDKINFKTPMNLGCYHSDDKKYGNGGGGFNQDYPENL